MAVEVTSSIVCPYKGDDTIDAAATVKHGEAVFRRGSPRSLVPGIDRGTPAGLPLPVPERVAGMGRGRACHPTAG